MTKVNVFITVDTEHSIGGAFQNPNHKPVGNEKRVFGKIGDTAYGIPLIMDIADLCKLPITFFVEVLNKYYFGENESREVCRYISDQGHDVQLHLHPNYLNFTLPHPQQMDFSDLIGNYSPSKQIQLLKESKALLMQNTMSGTVAFRAGCFGANMATLESLSETGFLIDSSYNTAYLGTPCLLPCKKINDLFWLNGLWEFPVTNFVEFTGLRAKRYMPLDINGVSFEEMRWVLRHAKAHGPKNVTIILHSFSFIKAYDVQYKKVRPRRHVIKRFEKLCRFLYENSDDFEVRTFGSLDETQLSQMAQQSVHTFPIVPAPLSLMRGIQQLKDNLL
ncbi:MAG: hypothetical protein BBJ57_05410 [Desulfobacterales bacterium PC51MH44]|nr:MAG: hypothetical protein BBJ57_05410 [Desulfobacterales bacterium PC51MH44]